MANVIKYSPGSTPTNAINTGEFAIGVNQGGYGSTASTGFWNGKTPNVSGYTIYQSNGASSPTLYAAANDSELITYSNQLGGSGNTTIGQALTYFKDNPGAGTCFNVDVPNIVTSGLTIYLDAGFTPSYPRTGTIWKDLSGSGNNSTLYNLPTYSSAYYGGIVLDGIDDYAQGAFTAPGVNAPWSMSCIFKAGTQLVNNGIICLGYLPFITLNANGNIFLLWWNGVGYGSITTSGVNYGDNSPHNVTATYDGTTVKLYADSILKGTSVSNVHAIYDNVTLGKEYNNGPKCLNGTIYNGSVYNRALSATEILQNYYAGLQRFIPTNGLVLYLDGNNTNKQVMTASTANDISGNNNTGTLTNGVTLARDGQRSFSFDGIDDYVSIPYSSTFNFSLGQTIILWLKPGTGAPLQRRNPYNQAYGGSGTITHEPAGDFSYYFGTNGGNAEPYSYFGSNCIVGENEVAFIAVTRNQTTNTCNFYKNGTLTNTGTAGGYTTTNNGSSPVQIGYGYTGWPFIGHIGQIRVHNTVLSAANILTLYTATKSRYGL